MDLCDVCSTNGSTNGSTNAAPNAPTQHQTHQMHRQRNGSTSRTSGTCCRHERTDERPAGRDLCDGAPYMGRTVWFESFYRLYWT